MKLRALEIENGKKDPIRIAMGAETPEGLDGILYLDNVPNNFSLFESLRFPFDYVYNLNGNGKGLVCRMSLSAEAKKFLTHIPNDYFEEDKELPGLISRISDNTSISRISISCDFKTGSYEIKPYY